MTLKIISPSAYKTIAIEWIEVQTPQGSFVIQPGHAPTALVLSANSKAEFLQQDGTQQSITLQKGILEVTRDTSSLLVNEYVWDKHA